MRIDDEFLFENILKTFFKLEQNITRLWWLPPKQITSLLDAQYYLFQLLWFGIGKLQEEEEPRQDLWSSRKKISIDHVAPQVGHKYQYQTMIEHMYTVLTWNIYSLSLAKLCKLIKPFYSPHSTIWVAPSILTFSDLFRFFHDFHIVLLIFYLLLSIFRIQKMFSTINLYSF